MNAHRFHPSILRDYDIRGIVGETLTAEDALAVGRAFGTRASAAGGATVCVGHDGRHSSPDLADAVSRGLADAGMAVLRIERGPTPMLYFAVHDHAAAGGVMVTGSHNPPDYNGFKMMLGGAPFHGAAIRDLGGIAAAGRYAAGPGAIRQSAVLPDYADRLVAGFRHGRPLSVVWDCGNGAAGPVVEAVCRRLPGRHRILFGEVDGRFPNHHPDPTVAANLTDLIAAVREGGADLGIGLDGDGDRIGVVDDGGAILWGDQLMALLAEPVLAASPGATIIADVKASQTLFDRIAELGGRPCMWRSGHSPIKEKMAETGSPFAGEMSGHLFFADRYYGYDDAIYAGIRLIEWLGRQDRPLSAFRRALPPVVNTPELRFPCPEERKFAVVAAVRAGLRGRGDVRITAIDGVRVQTGHGWWLLRASNTQDALVARCESDSEAGLRHLAADLSACLRAAGIDPPDFDL